MNSARRFALPLLAPLAIVSLAACKQKEPEAAATTAAAPEAKEGLKVTDGKFVLPAVSGNPGAAYFVLDNQGMNAVSIAAIAIDGVGKTEVHQTMGGSMKPVDRIDVEAKTPIKFERGALHVMAFDVDGKLKAGGTTEMTITFSDGDKLSAPLTIEAAGGGDAMGSMGGMEKHN